MPCSCGRTECECEGVCHCCPFMCMCQQCIEIRRRLGAYCGPCGGHMTPIVCSTIPEWKRTGQYPNYPNLDFLRIHTHQPTSSSASDERAHTRSAPEATESSPAASLSAPEATESSPVASLSAPEATSSSSTASLSAPEATESSSTASRKSAPEPSQSPPRESDTLDNSRFQMDMDPSREVSTNTSTGAKSRDFHGSSHSSSNKSISDYMLIWTPLHDVNDSRLEEYEREQIATQNVAGCSQLNPSTSDSEIKKSRAKRISPYSKVGISRLNRPELLEREMPQTTQGVPGCSHPNPNTAISKLEESQVSDKSSKPKIGEDSLKRTKSQEREMITKDIPGCSYRNLEESLTDSVSHAASQSADECASDSLPSKLHSGDSPPSTFLVSPRSPTNPLSTSEPQSTCELQSSEQKETLSVGTSPTSNLSEFETLRISDSRPIDKSTSFESSSVDILPENRPNEERYDALHGQADIPSLSVASSQLNNTAVQAESSQSSSKSDSSSETISRERTDKSDDEAPTNKSPKEK